MVSYVGLNDKEVMIPEIIAEILSVVKKNKGFITDGDLYTLQIQDNLEVVSIDFYPNDKINFVVYGLYLKVEEKENPVMFESFVHIAA